MKVIKLNESQLRALIAEELTQAGGAMAGARAIPSQKLREHLEGAKQALSEMFQSASSPKASEQAQALLAGLNRLIKAMDTMPELTGHDERPRPSYRM